MPLREENEQSHEMKERPSDRLQRDIPCIQTMDEPVQYRDFVLGRHLP